MYLQLLFSYFKNNFGIKGSPGHHHVTVAGEGVEI
jgi:hypothetical protein